MTSELIPYIDECHPVTGLTNGKFGTWLFLASEVMLFGALFSTYLMLRMGASLWPRDALPLLTGGFNTALLMTSTLTMALGVRALRAGNFGKFRLSLGVTILLSLAFLAIKLGEYRVELGAGNFPSVSTFYALYFTLTGFHGLHVLGGIIVNAYLWGPGSGLWGTRPRQFVGRVECAALYWYFVDLVWLVLFTALYLT